MKALAFCCALITVAGALLCQEPNPPADSTLAGITARGRLLAQYDVAAWHGGDALGALNPAGNEISCAVARPMSDGRWEVLYGRLTAAKDTFYVRYHAMQTNADSAFTAERYPAPKVYTGVEREMAAAVQTAVADFGQPTRPYNSYVIPAGPGGFWVYLLPAQTDPRTFPHGGDVRDRVTDGGTRIVERVRFYQAVINFPTTAPPGTVAGTHTSLDSLPSETDVFLVLRRPVRLPENVVTQHFEYEVRLDGTISWRRTGK